MFRRIKDQWEITKNWHYIYPILGVVSLGYSVVKLVLLFNFANIFLTGAISIAFFFILLKLTVALLDFLNQRWKPKYKWQVIRIFLIFAVTGSMSVVITNPIFEVVGFTKANIATFPLGTVVFYILKFLLILPFYKVLLVFFGWLFGEYRFFLNFAIKMASRFGFKSLLKKIDAKQ